MSLINDALKRATQAQSAHTPPAQPEEPMLPVERRSPVGLPVYFMPVMLFIISGACFFVVKGWQDSRVAQVDPLETVIHARERVARIAAEEVEQPVPADRQFALNDGPNSEPAPAVARSLSAPLPSATAAPAAGLQEESTPGSSLRLQGIFYRPGNPSAVVNAKTVFVGDSVANGKVSAISRESVTIQLAGETKVLTLH